MVNGITEYEFQNDCVDYLIDKTVDGNSKRVITVKAPTGAGKTVILIKYVDKYLKNSDGKTAFIWLCPGKGNLEEQSKDSMETLAPNIDTRTLMYSMIAGFSSGSVTFINWELVTKKGNNALKDSEKANLFERIAEAHKDGLRFVIIIDEEHMNNTAKADDIINAFAAKNIIRVSATANKVLHQEFYEIPENEVISAGLITRAIYVNEGVNEKTEIENDYDYLLELADNKRKELLDAYKMVKADVRPLVLIQFPVGQPETISAVQDKLAAMGYTYDNGMVNIWMSDDKMISDDLTELNGTPAFLLMKQAISTGWDCPRAKILVKLREGGSQDFQIQTIGRIRRMPERKHYIFPAVLDFCYLYTLDTQYKEGLLSSLDKAYQVRRLFSKEKVRDFTMTKELRNLDIDTGIGERELLKRVYEHLKKKYNLGKDKAVNITNMTTHGYTFSHEIDSKILQGVFATTSELTSASTKDKVTVKTIVNTHSHGIYLLHSVDEIKKIVGVPSQKVKNILQRLFRKGSKTQYKLFSLENNDFYAFIINNVHNLKNEFREIVAEENGRQIAFMDNAKTATFKIPDMEVYKYAAVKDIRVFEHNAYKEYTSEFVTSISNIRSTPERLFEYYCEENKQVEWYYKNGDVGQQYLSVVYQDGISHQWLFYPDYIVKMTNGDVWIIETKGGMQNGHTKNIDQQVANKFIAFKEYAKKYNLNWGFVRDIDEKLYINNTVYSDDMSGDNWVELSKLF